MISKKMLPVSYECAVCSKFGNFSCERCGETYCSKMCQVTDWREHRRICMPIPRLLQREVNGNAFPLNRMLMDGSVHGYDATDANGNIVDSNISENSAPSDSVPMTKEQITKLTTSLKQMQLENTLKNQRPEFKASLTEVNEAMHTPTVTPKTLQPKGIVQPVANIPKIDENANYTASSPVKPVDASPKVAKVVVPPPSPKKSKNFNPSMRVVQSKAQVILVHVENHHTVFVVPSCSIKEWKELVDRSNEYAKIAKPLKNPPEPGHIILAKPKGSDTFSRALVKRTRAQDKIAKVEFMEYGFVEVVRFTEIKCLSEELVNVPRLVNMLTLQSVPEEMEKSQEAVDFLTKLQENQTELIIKQLEPIEKSNVSAHFRVTLLHGESFSSINETIKDLNNVDATTNKMDIVEEPAQPPNRREIEYIGISGQNMEIYVIDNSFMQIGFFSAIEAKNMSLLAKNDGIINENVKEFEAGLPFHPREGETCLAQSAEDKRWYRATAQQKLDGDLYNLMYLDYGNMEEVPSDRIREMKENFFFPCITSLCYIAGLKEKLKPAAVARLKTLIEPYTRITFDEVQYNGEDAQCTSSGIMNILGSEGLI